MRATLHMRISPVALGITPTELGPLNQKERAERLRQAARALEAIARELDTELARAAR